jgi:hypothetical protein
MNGDYKAARHKLAQALKEIYPLIAGGDEEEEEEFQIDKAKGFVRRWVMYFETMAPYTDDDEQGTFHSYAYGLYCLSDDGTNETSMQDWEIVGMTEWARDNEIYG